MTPIGAISCGFALLSGAIIGSFLTVVVARVPAMVLANPSGCVSGAELLRGLAWPSSRCSTCATPVRVLDNIPLISFVALRGRCRACRAPIGRQYLALEAAAAIAALTVTLRFGWTGQAALVAGLLWVLLALCRIDLAELLLPDVLVLPLLPLGLLYQWRYGAGFLNGLEATAVAGGLFWGIAEAFRRARGLEGLGGGDIKLAAALAAWVGLQSEPLFLLGSFATGLVAVGVPVLLKRREASSPAPFGPFIAASGAVFVLAPHLAIRIQGLLV